jgi:cytochrome b subunit of formate dehydrogenase
MTASQVLAPARSEPTGRVRRHLLIDRLYHWLAAASVLVLMGTAFLPIVGWKFEWLTLHWTTGILLTVLVLVHIVRALVWQDWRAMVIDPADIRNAWRVIRRRNPGKAGKYNIPQKLYHLAVALLILSTIATGLLMLLKIDTPFWQRNPYWLAADTWGIIYSIHGFAAMALITLIMIHIYFAIRPDEWWQTRSMFRGWISQTEYREHCDSARWRVSD